MSTTQILLLLAAAAAVLLGLIAFLFLRRRRRYGLLERRLEEPSRPLDDKEIPRTWRIIVPPPDNGTAERRYSDRAADIARFFASNESQLSANADELRTVPVREYIETIPGFETTSSSALLDTPYAACGQAARLIWQLREPHFALTERVSDLIATVGRQVTSGRARRDGSPFEYPTLRLESLDESEYGNRVFPWVVVVETSNFEPYRAIIEGVKDWLGIAVAIGPARRVELFGNCKIGAGGLDGIAGGAFSSQQQVYLLTCAHVLSEQCHSTIMRGNPKNNENEPDAAIIRSSTPCFDSSLAATPCRQADPQEVKSYIQARTPVLKTHPHCDTKPGFIRNYAFGFDVGGTFHRFPHLEVLPILSSIGPVDWPVVGRTFSKPGDSGAWVLGRNSNIWFGMVTGGDEFSHSTFIAESGALMEYLTLLAISQVIPSVHSPAAFV